MKDIKKLLRKNAENILPDDRIKDKIKNELGYNEAQSSLAYAHGGERTINGRRKIIISVCAAALAIILILGIALPLALRDSDGPATIIPGPIVNKFNDITDADSFYAYGAVSIGSIIASSDNTVLTSAAVLTSSAAAGSANSADYGSSGHNGNGSLSGSEEDITETITKYMALVENLMGTSGIDGVITDGTDGYQHTMTVTYTDLLGETVSYSMMYNKTLTDSETNEDETEENYSIDGILILGNNSYPVEGSYESETEDNETESEMSFRAYFTDDRRSYISVEQEYETETEDGESETETEYVYSVYENGRLTEQTTVEYEKEDDELELMMTIRSGSRTETLTFKDGTENGKRILHVSGNLDGQRVNFRIYIEKGEYRYVFENGHKEDWERD